jgi:hypothetical protein
MSVDFPSIDALRKLKAAQDRYVLIMGLGIGVTLVLYFFTFAQLIDHGYTGLLWFQAISSIVMIAALFMLKRLAFCLVRLFHGRKPACRAILARIGPSDLDQEAEKLAAKLVSESEAR